jgi:outer membrane receptor protein involved in Fe transport
MKRLLPTITFLISSAFSYATDVRGFVKEAKTGEPLTGASVHLKNTTIGTFVGLDGSFQLKGVSPATYTLVASFVGYATVEREITVGDQKTQLINFELQEGANQLNEIVVQGIGDNESAASALRSEQKADNVINIIGAKTIQLLPDITVGNLLQRVSGVSIVRNGSGEGQYAIIRGMDRRYNYTLINGIKIPSPDDKNRYVPMDIFPSDLLERLEVVKALTPNMEGDAIGGAMNMIMKSAPDYLTVSATASGGYSQLFANQSFSGFSTDPSQAKAPSEKKGDELYAAPPSDFSIKPLQYKNVAAPINSLLSFSIGNRIFNHKLGVFVGGSYQHSFRGSNVTFFTLNGQPNPDPQPNTPIFTGFQTRVNSNEQSRFGSNVKFDYALTKNSKISLLGLIMQLEDWQHRSIQNTTAALTGDAGYGDRSVYRKQNIYNATLQGDHSIVGNFKLNWSTVYSLASSTRPAWSDLSVTVNTTQDAAGNIIETGRYLGGVSQRWTHNEDRDLTGYLNLTYTLSPSVELATGGLYRDKDRNNYYNNYGFSSAVEGSGSTKQVFTTIDKAILSFNDLRGNFGFASYTDAQNYTAKEQVGAGYLQGKFNFQKLQIVGGVRMENTKINMVTQVPVTQEGRIITNNYTDILPSIHFKYSLTERENLRLSYFRGISRPSFAELNPGLLQGDFFNESGNPRVRHIVADNVDLRYEFFPGGNSQLLVGTFYKNIQDPIEYGFKVISQVRTDYTPQNFGTATNYGFELVFAKFIKNFGVSGNYTYTQSQITTSKLIISRDSNGGTVTTQGDQTRPLQGQSDHIGNLSFLYKNQVVGLNAQFSWVYTGPRITVVSPFKDLDYWQRGNSQIDFSGDKKLSKNFSLFVKVTNLFNAPIIVDLLKANTFKDLPDQNRTDRILIQKDIFQQNYLLGIRYKY